MQNYTNTWMPYIQSMNIPNQMYPMMAMPEQQLESMYPKVYHAIYPAVVQRCDAMDMKYGPTYIPDKKEVESMIDDIYIRVEGDVNIIIEQEYGEHNEDRQFGYGGRGLLRGFIGALLIRDLIGRRRRPFYGSPFGGGFGSPYYGGGFGGGYGYY